MTLSTLQATLEADGLSVLAQLRHWATHFGEQPCIFYGEAGSTLNYREFDAITDNMAGNLASMGIQKGDHVSVLMRNQYQTILCMFAIWKAGAVFSPINFGFQGQLLHYQLTDTSPKLLLTEHALVGALNEVWEATTSVQAVVIYRPAATDHDFVADAPEFTGHTPSYNWEQLCKPCDPPHIDLQFDDCANIIYTSGTTGPAKGVILPHRWMNQYTFMFRQLLNQEDVVYNDLPMYHVGGAVFNIVRAIWAGSSIACWDRFSPSQFWGRIQQSQATSAVLVDTMIAWLAKAPPCATDNHHTLRKVHMQPLPEKHHDIARRFGFDLVTCGFGQTESGMPCFSIIEETDHHCETPVAFRKGRSREAVRDRATHYNIAWLPYAEASSVGKGYMGHSGPFMEVTVLDDRDQHCAPNQPGQLAFRPKLPALVLQEYLGKPQATVTSFRNLWFHTGDSAIRTPDNAFYFIDRMGDRIRVRGENTSSFHIEDLLNQCPGVAMSAVFGIAAEEGYEDDIVAYVVPQTDHPITAQALTAWAHEHMPKFMRPRHIRIITELPRTLTQKVEKFKLKKAILNELHRSA